jgi:hypothetical protein
MDDMFQSGSKGIWAIIFAICTLGYILLLINWIKNIYNVIYNYSVIGILAVFCSGMSYALHRIISGDKDQGERGKNFKAEWKKSLVLLIPAIIVMVIEFAARLWQIVAQDGGAIFGDVTLHYFASAILILSGQSPYGSMYVNWPPLELFFFTICVAIHPAPLSIGLPLMCLYFSLPVLLFIILREFLSFPQAIIGTTFIVLNPLIANISENMIDSELITVIGLLVIFHFQKKQLIKGVVAGAVFGLFMPNVLLFSAARATPPGSGREKRFRARMMAARRSWIAT